jgi:hypothetical protein
VALPRVALPLLCLAAIAAFAVQDAGAVILPRPQGRTLSYQPIRPPRAAVTPFDSIFHDLDYGGGPVMASNTNYAVYWDPSGAPAYPSDYQPGLDQFFEDLAHDSGGVENVDSISAQYNDAAGQHASYDSHFGGALLDADPYPANGCRQAPICLTDAQIRAELGRFVKAARLPIDLAHEYFLLTPPGVESCFEAAGNRCSAGASEGHRAFCAYHGGIPVSAEGVIVYANDPYVAGGVCDDGNHPNGTTADATISGGLSHEHNESITDPEPNNAWTDWATGASTGYEVGDKCRTFSSATEFGTPPGTAADGAFYNQVINGHPYWYQQEWSNQGHECLQRLSLSGSPATATYTFQSSEHETSFDAGGSTAPGGVSYYEWQLGEFAGQAPIETTSPTFRTASSHAVLRVALTVFAADGTSAGTAHVVNIGAIPAPVVTKVTPTKAVAGDGTTITVTGANFVEGEATSVSFGGAAAAFTVVSGTKITAVAPATVVGTVDVTVSTRFGTSATSTKDLVKLLPAVTGVSPASGARAGGTAVTVTGAGFAPGATAFKFGTTLARSVECASSTTCTMTAPAHSPGLVDVKATVSKLTSAKVQADEFTYS